MYRELTTQGIRVPNGFAITAQAYRDMLTHGNAWSRLHEALDGLNPADVDDLARRARAAREIVYGTPLPEHLADQIVQAYRRLVAGIRRTADGRGAQLGDRRGFADRQLRRAA